MKNLASFFVLLLFVNHITMAQKNSVIPGKQAGKYKNYMGKGDLAISAHYITNPVSAVQNIKYELKGVDINTVYYIMDHLGLEADIAAFRYNATSELNKNFIRTEDKALDQQQLISGGSGIRYNFLEKYHCGTLYLQTGYSFGHFENKVSKNLHRWEVITIGFSSSFLRKIIPNVDFDCRIGIAKDNVHSNLPRFYKGGLTYQFGNIRKKYSLEH